MGRFTWAILRQKDGSYLTNRRGELIMLTLTNPLRSCLLIPTTVGDEPYRAFFNTGNRELVHPVGGFMRGQALIYDEAP